jgi:hypothetical protein
MSGYPSFAIELNHLIFGHKWIFDGSLCCEKDLTMQTCPGFALYICELCGEVDYGENEENEDRCKHCVFEEKEEYD